MSSKIKERSKGKHNMTNIKELKEKDLEKVSGSYKKVDTGGYEFANGDCFKWYCVLENITMV